MGNGKLKENSKIAKNGKLDEKWSNKWKTELGEYENRKKQRFGPKYYTTCG